MKSAKRPGLMRPLILALPLLSLTACASRPPILTSLAAIECGTLIPKSYRQSVPGVTPPGRCTAAGTCPQVAAYGGAFVGQTHRLDQANGRTADVIATVDTCDARNAAILKAMQPKPPGWQFWRR